MNTLRLKHYFSALALLMSLSPSRLNATDAARPYQITSVSALTKQPQLKSKLQKEIPVVRFGSTSLQPDGSERAPKFRFYIQAGLHGNENLTTKFAFWLITRLKEGRSRLSAMKSNDVAFDIVPTANPDGLRADTRYNANFVNLNRNFSFLWGLTKESPGKASFSEPETQAIRALFDSSKYSAAVDIHGYINWVVAPSEPTSNSDHLMVSRYKTWVGIIQNHMKGIQDTYKLRTAGQLGDGGAFEDWAFWDKQVPAFCLEMASAFRMDVAYKANGSIKKVDTFDRYEEFLFKVFTDHIESAKTGMIAIN